MRFTNLIAALALLACTAHAQTFTVTPQIQTYGYQSWRITVPNQQPMQVIPGPTVVSPVPITTTPIAPTLVVPSGAYIPMPQQRVQPQMPPEDRFVSIYLELAKRAHTPEAWAAIERYKTCFLDRQTAQVTCLN